MGGTRDIGMTYLLALAREIVRGFLNPRDTGSKLSVATVVGREDGVLEAGRVVDVEVELAILAILSHGDVWAQ
jgi:hypothetical protein